MKIASINFDESIKSRKLKFKKNFEFYFEIIFQIFINLALIFGLIINLINWKEYGINEKSFLLVFIIFTLYFNLLLFKKLTENNLVKIITKNSTEEHKRIVLDYIKQNNIQVLRNSKDTILAIDDYGSTGLFSWKKNHIILLFHQNQIFFTLLTERQKVNFPSFFDKFSLKKDLIKITNMGFS